jgi:hypothetical protein
MAPEYRRLHRKAPDAGPARWLLTARAPSGERDALPPSASACQTDAMSSTLFEFAWGSPAFHPADVLTFSPVGS